MNKIEYLNLFQINSEFTRNLFNAFLQVLSSKETIQAYAQTLNIEDNKRNLILRKIGNDISLKFEEHHLEFIDGLIIELQNKAYHKVNRSGYILSLLYDKMPMEVKNNILINFLSNRYHSVRNRGYKILHFDWQECYRNTIIQNWKKYLDSSCAYLIVKNFEPYFLLDHFQLIEKHLDKQWKLKDLYQKVAKYDESIHKYIKSIDEITYCYILVQIGKSISETEAHSIYKKNVEDERIGLLIWCFGKFKLWNLLLQIESKYSYS